MAARDSGHPLGSCQRCHMYVGSCYELFVEGDVSRTRFKGSRLLEVVKVAACGFNLCDTAMCIEHTYAQPIAIAWVHHHFIKLYFSLIGAVRLFEDLCDAIPFGNSAVIALDDVVD